MRPRTAAVLVILGAGLAHLGLAAPLRSRALAAGEQSRRATQRSLEARARLTELKRRAGALSAATGAARDPRSLRRSVVASLEGADVSGVRIRVRPGRSPVAATLNLSVYGQFTDLVELSGQLVRPGTGLILARVRLTTRASDLSMEVDGLGLEDAQ